MCIMLCESFNDISVFNCVIDEKGSDKRRSIKEYGVMGKELKDNVTF